MLAYEPDPAGRGTSHAIDVKVARKGLHVYTQRRVAAAVAPARAASDPAAEPALAARTITLDEALGGLLPLADRPLALNLAAVAGIDDGQPTVNVRVDAMSFLEGRTFTAPLEVGVTALDAYARQVATVRQTSTVTLVGGAGAGRPPEAPSSRVWTCRRETTGSGWPCGIPRREPWRRCSGLSRCRPMPTPPSPFPM